MWAGVPKFLQEGLAIEARFVFNNDISPFNAFPNFTYYMLAASL
jgi:hypothetical protein